MLLAVALVVATHWPGVAIHGPVDRPDLIIHAVVFAVFALLAVNTGWFGRPGSARAAVLTGLAVVTFAGLDEWSQHLPPFHRHTALDDWLADVAGVVVALAAHPVWARRRARESDAPAPPGPMDSA